MRGRAPSPKAPTIGEKDALPPVARLRGATSGRAARYHLKRHGAGPACRLHWRFQSPGYLPCGDSQSAVLFPWFWKGGESLFRRKPGGRKVRTPPGAMPRNRSTPTQEGAGRIHAGGEVVRPPHGKCHREHTAKPGRRLLEVPAVRVKRWGKSPPLQAQARRQGKPRRVQGQIGNPGAARSMFRTAERVPGTGCIDK